MFLIPRIPLLNAEDLAETSLLLRELPAYAVACNNWPAAYPYSPEVNFRIAHNGPELFIIFSVKESCCMAMVTEDNGKVWTDSCVEFFFTPDTAAYYNFEFSCIGKALLGFRKEGAGTIHASPDILQSIRRFSTLGSANFKEKRETKNWELTVAIPARALFRHSIREWTGLQGRANAYKCGDALSQPHYLSWQPIDTPAPNFHIPRCFTEIGFSE